MVSTVLTVHLSICRNILLRVLCFFSVFVKVQEEPITSFLFPKVKTKCSTKVEKPITQCLAMTSYTLATSLVEGCRFFKCRKSYLSPTFLARSEIEIWKIGWPFQVSEITGYPACEFLSFMWYFAGIKGFEWHFASSSVLNQYSFVWKATRKVNICLPNVLFSWLVNLIYGATATSEGSPILYPLGFLVF